MKILVVGSGAREHALVRALSLDQEVSALVAAPGNPGMADLAHLLPGVTDVTDAAAIVAAARDQAVDLVVIGPEAPLVSGVADAVREAGFACFGPSAPAAMLEGSKAFAKEIMAAAEVPTGLAHVCSTELQVRDALDATGAPYVVKDDGLAAGKGVVVTDDAEQALAHALSCLAKIEGRVVVEEFLDGPEVSLFCLTDGRTVVPLEPAQDFKRIGEGDTGPNTGGMGAYSPLPWAEEQVPDLVQAIVDRVARPTVEEMRRRGIPFTGVLYVGLALTSRGPRVVEFNARFGDPETQSVLARLRTPLSSLLYAVATGQLDEVPPLTWRPETAVTVVLAAQGYPEAPVTGGSISGLERVAEVPDTHVLHAGTARDADGGLVSAGGRVLSVVALGADLDQARERAYRAVDVIDFPTATYRRDIAAAAAGDVVVPGPVEHPRPGPADPRPGPAGTPRPDAVDGPGATAYRGELAGHLPVHAGKVRELYAPLDPATGLVDESRLLLVASDRVSAYDHVLDTPIPDKGAVLTQLSSWWFAQLADVVPHHLLDLEVPPEVAGRAVYVRALRMLPVEAIARAYLTGGGLAEYHATGTVSGVRLPEGLVDGSRLPEPVFTPSTKAAAGEHDQPMTFAEVETLLGLGLAARVRDLTVAILRRGGEIAGESGILIADTKVEFGVDPDALGLDRDAEIDWPALDTDAVELVLADEVLTPDSSRFWRAQEWAPGRAQTSYDKQVLRDWLTGAESDWDGSGDTPPPALPDHVVELTRARYVEAYETLTGSPFTPPSGR